MPLPSTDNFSYQFWVVHLKGKNGDAYKLANNINEKGKFIKVQNTLAEFFALQFDEIRPEEKDNIRQGLTANCKTLYIIAFNLHRPNHITIIGAVQYSAAPEGVWINWLGISADIQPKVTTSSKKEIRVFRRLGLGMFLQNLVQFQQISKGWSERIFLQTLRGSQACDYYKN
jgi:hypothetical protein